MTTTTEAPRGRATDAPSLAEVEKRIAAATRALVAQARPDGHWCFELETDCTIPAEYVLLRHHRAEPVDRELEGKIATYLLRAQGEHGGWPLVHGGGFDISASVKAYFALKMIGRDVDEPAMRRAREAILARGGAATSNVFTRFLLALYGEVPWRAVPVMPVEILLLPRWFPFHLDKVSYWARTVIVPLTVLQALKPRARNPLGIRVQELFTAPPETVRRWPKGPHQTWPWTALFGALDSLLQRLEPWAPIASRKRAIEAAVTFLKERLNGLDGVGAIYPAMANTVLMFDALGYPPDHPDLVTARESVERLLVVKEDEAYCQPCHSPVWDTALACHALMEVGTEEAEARARQGLQWLKPRQVLDLKGDWAVKRPHVRPGGWPFQYSNPHYPDLDDTAVVVMGMHRLEAKSAGAGEFGQAIERGSEWVSGLQSRNGGFAAYDADNTHHYLNHIPFADHGALLDPPTADVTARCLSMFAQLGAGPADAKVARALECLLAEQRPDGSWFGRWGINYVYGTWSALAALNAVGHDPRSPAVRRAVAWLAATQNPDGGWGESDESYRLDYRGYEAGPSSASQTAWAILGLMAAGEVDHPAVERGIRYLADTQADDGFWPEETFTGTGFPRVLYLRYHGYPKFFPLWALARYRNLKRGNSRNVAFGI